jgi:YVTN family beta-propeller protein
VTPDGNFIYVVNANGGSVSKIATATDTVVQTIPGLTSPKFGLAVTPNG